MTWENFRVALFEKAPQALFEHSMIVLVTISLAILISIPLGVLLTRPRFKRFGLVILNLFNVLQAVPGLAVIALALPILGLGLKPAVLALLFQSLLPIVRNTMAGLMGVSPDVKEAARGMGMSQRRILIEVGDPVGGANYSKWYSNGHGLCGQYWDTGGSDWSRWLRQFDHGGIGAFPSRILVGRSRTWGAHGDCVGEKFKLSGVSNHATWYEVESWWRLANG